MKFDENAVHALDKLTFGTSASLILCQSISYRHVLLFTFNIKLIGFDLCRWASTINMLIENFGETALKLKETLGNQSH